MKYSINHFIACLKNLALVSGIILISSTEEQRLLKLSNENARENLVQYLLTLHNQLTKVNVAVENNLLTQVTHNKSAFEILNLQQLQDYIIRSLVKTKISTLISFVERHLS